MALIDDTWEKPITRSLNYIQEYKLKVVKPVLKYWVKILYIPLEKERKECQKQLEGIQKQMEEEELIEHMLQEERDTSQNLHAVFRNEEEEW